MFQDILLKLVVFFLPTQLGLHFWPSFSRVSGIKIDYLSPTIYFVDILIALFVIVSWKKVNEYLKFYSLSIPILIFIAVNLLFSQNLSNTLVQYLRVLEYLLLYMVLVKTPNLHSKTASAFLLSLFLVITIQCLQFLTQKSLNGAFYYLGERFFTSNSPNTSHISLANRYLLRVPSIFSHPNSLAGFLLLSALFLRKHTKNKPLSHFVLLSVILTFSKSALLGILFSYTKINLGKKIIIIYICLSIAQIFVSSVTTGISSIDTRTVMIQNYLKQPPKNFLVGSGLGSYPYVISGILPGSSQTVSNIQPVHNLLLLLLSELGIPFTTYLLYLIYKHFKPDQYYIFSVLLITGLFDHYWLTLPQNKLLLIYLLSKQNS